MGDDPPAERHGNFWVPTLRPQLCRELPAGASFGVEELIGNGWEWTATLFAPLPALADATYPQYWLDSSTASMVRLTGHSDNLTRRSSTGSTKIIHIQPSAACTTELFRA